MNIPFIIKISIYSFLYVYLCGLPLSYFVQWVIVSCFDGLIVSELLMRVTSQDDICILNLHNPLLVCSFFVFVVVVVVF